MSLEVARRSGPEACQGVCCVSDRGQGKGEEGGGMRAKGTLVSSRPLPRDDARARRARRQTPCPPAPPPSAAARLLGRGSRRRRMGWHEHPRPVLALGLLDLHALDSLGPSPGDAAGFRLPPTSGRFARLVLRERGARVKLTAWLPCCKFPNSTVRSRRQCPAQTRPARSLCRRPRRSRPRATTGWEEPEEEEEGGSTPLPRRRPCGRSLRRRSIASRPRGPPPQSRTSLRCTGA